MGWFRDGLSGFELSVDPELLALLLSSAVFGFFHPITKMYILLAGLMGVYFGVLLMWSGNLLVPIVAHAAYDAVQLLMTKRQVERKDRRVESDPNALEVGEEEIHD